MQVDLRLVARTQQNQCFLPCTGMDLYYDILGFVRVMFGLCLRETNIHLSIPIEAIQNTDN